MGYLDGTSHFLRVFHAESHPFCEQRAFETYYRPFEFYLNPTRHFQFLSVGYSSSMGAIVETHASKVECAMSKRREFIRCPASMLVFSI